MWLEDAELDESSGDLIVRGEISVGKSDENTVPIAPHQRLLLTFAEGSPFSPGALLVWPISKVERTENGFCIPVVDSPGICFDGLTKADIDVLLSMMKADESRRLIRKGYRSRGSFKKQLPLRRPYCSLLEFEVSGRLASEGLILSISGTAEADFDQLNGAEELGCHKILVSATIGWEALTLKRFYCAIQYWKFEHDSSGEDQRPFGRVRSPFRLGDLLVASPGYPNSLVTPGHFHLDDLADGGISQPSIKYVGVEINSDGMSFRPVHRVFAGNNGTVKPLLGQFTLNTRHANIVDFDKLFEHKNEISFFMGGEGVGQLIFHFFYSDPNLGRDPPGWSYQNLKHMSVTAALDQAGLCLNLTIMLDDFEDREIERQRANYGTVKTSYKKLLVQAHLPWSFLLISGWLPRQTAEAFERGHK